MLVGLINTLVLHTMTYVSDFKGHKKSANSLLRQCKKSLPYMYLTAKKLRYTAISHFNNTLLGVLAQCPSATKSS